MQRWPWWVASLSLIWGCSAEDGPEPAALSGVVIAADTEAPLPSVSIVVRSGTTSRATTTGEGGRYRVLGLNAGTTYGISASTPNYDPKGVSLALEPGENTADFTLIPRTVCAPGARRCSTVAGVEAVLTCNARGTGYTSSPCAEGLLCRVETSSCAAGNVLSLVLVGEGEGNVTSVPAGISCPGVCAAEFPAQTMVELNAAPGASSSFGAWAGACSGRMPSCVVTVSGEVAVRARFVSSLPRLTVQREGEGVVRSTPAGINCGSDCTENYTPGTMITLAAAAADRWVFGAWEGCPATPSGIRCIFPMPERGPTIRARFDPYFSVPLAADGSCRVLLHFDPANRWSHACGGGGPAVATGTVSFVASRTAALGEAVEAGGTTEEGWIDTAAPGPQPPVSTVELTIQQLGPAFEGRGAAVLYSDRAVHGAGPGFRLMLADDGTLSAQTSDGASTSAVSSAAGAIQPMQWVQVAATIDAADGLRLYADGVQIAELAGPLSWTASASTGWAGAAREAGGGAIHRLDGRIDELRVSNTRRY